MGTAWESRILGRAVMTTGPQDDIFPIATKRPSAASARVMSASRASRPA
ncbi:MAG: hypothetical protein IAE79_00930 [Anaerolinea sp.]|nr:hypothetical protein [Anaerolinea sp.]